MISILLIVAIAAAVIAAALYLSSALGGTRGVCSGGECIILPVRGRMEDIEFRIRRVAAHRRGMKLCVVNFGGDGETCEIARRLCGEIDGAYWVERESLIDFLAAQ